MTPEQQLKVISKAWGKQSGYCFFPWINGAAGSREERIKSYHEGPAFLWPKDRDKILAHMRAHTTDELYWCPSLFEKPQRKMELAMDEHALWADLDDVDPREIEDYPPTIAWESSPGRYQALWLITGGLMGASWRGNENHRLTYYLGADVSGWDTTQLLRIPGNANRKFEYWKNGQREVPGKLLWESGRRYLPDDFEDLPEVQHAGQVAEILEGEIDHVDRHEVWGRVRLRVSKRVRDLVGAREASGDRSSALWEIERELADAGCTVTEIVAVARATCWNKYEGRQDELKRLTIEAAKAIELRSEKAAADLEEETGEKPTPQNLFAMMESVRPPEWLITNVLAVGACGFIAGQPKTFKSWVGLDMALSIATGLPFLDHFPIRKPGPVLYVQEEDSAPMVKSRLSKVWPGKQMDKMKTNEAGELEWHPPDERDRPRINATITAGVVVSDPGWQSWLDEELAKGYDGDPYAALILDPLMMMAGEIDDNRAQEMTTKIFKPLKDLARKHNVALMIVHHMKKTDAQGKPIRGGQLLLGSVANHAWAEDSLYLKLNRGDVVVERESKHTTSGSFRISGVRNKRWTPAVTDDRMSDGDDDEVLAESAGSPARRPRSNGRGRNQKRPEDRRSLDALKEMGGTASTTAIAGVLEISPSGAYKQLLRAEGQGLVKRKGRMWKLAGTR